MKFALVVSLLLVIACGGCQRAAMLPKDMTLDLGNGVTMKFVLIPAGKFIMGSPASEIGRNPDETQHKVTISKPFYMSVTKVTQAQYFQLCGYGGGSPSYFRDDTNPADSVTWDDAVEFCQRLSKKTHVTVRLPTEAEWEYACRAGSATRFFFGDGEEDLGDHAWYAENSGGTTHPVGEKKPNAWGLYDMLGNVWEWCADWYDDYPGVAVTDPQGPASGTIRVLRGGAWNGIPVNCRSANRNYNNPDLRDYDHPGFRVVISVPDLKMP